MPNFDRKSHWENIYQTQDLRNSGWFQPTPETSLNFIEKFNVPKSAKIIDVGGGDSLLVDNLLERGYKDITVLDISAEAIDRAKQRLGDKAEQVSWIVSDVTQFQPTETYDFWHDRAVFHFLRSKEDISAYVETAQKAITPKGILVMGTFSEQGPTKCSGIEIQQYSETSLTGMFKPHFEKVNCRTVDHETPSGSVQNFVFCSFKKK
ncbi:methyltransferase domain-containing protein [Psychroflexus sp. CAK8W]|uniref:Methyltransferase domain-containing protein n=1 Tax=Psychroflexus longus TaxID=2873596 RepID=A0ABS7XLM4_9FLAO|nr:class I SAM-dependent methyltransferase [Psychroflexus longus]MBZ9779895.1 methyltransferase domain-containing protein [Psychroflexus longus]